MKVKVFIIAKAGVNHNGEVSIAKRMVDVAAKCGVDAIIEKFKVTLLPVSPTFLNLLLLSEAYKRHRLDSLKMITYGTEPMSKVLLNRLRSIFPNVQFLQTYGTTETGIVKTQSKSSDSVLVKFCGSDFSHKIIHGVL